MENLAEICIGIVIVIFVFIIKLIAREADLHEEALRQIIEKWSDDEEKE